MHSRLGAKVELGEPYLGAQAIECLHTPSRSVVVGVKCLEEAYSSLAEGNLL
jgi:hypothetical protein